MAVIWKIVSGLQADGIPDNDPVFDLAAEKSWAWIFRWECLSALDSEQAFKSYHIYLEKEMIIPRKYLREFELIKFPALNPNDHFHIQN